MSDLFSPGNAIYEASHFWSYPFHPVLVSFIPHLCTSGMDSPFSWFYLCSLVIISILKVIHWNCSLPNGVPHCCFFLQLWHSFYTHREHHLLLPHGNYMYSDQNPTLWVSLSPWILSQPTSICLTNASFVQYFLYIILTKAKSNVD